MTRAGTTRVFRRLLVGGALALGVIVLLGVVFRGPIALRIMQTVVERNLSTDPIAGLSDGLHVMLCGSGGPLASPNRSGPCVAVLAGKRLFVVDAGSGGARNLTLGGLPPALVEAVFLTHFHSDHIDGLGELQLQRWPAGSHETPLVVYGPTGVEDVVAGFNLAYQQDAAYRVAHHGADAVPPSGAGMVAHPFAPPTAGRSLSVLDEGGLRVVAFDVDHEPANPAVGYRFDYGGRSVLISGDTSKSAELARNAKGVDLLVHEALAPRLMAVPTAAARVAGRDNLAKITLDVLDYHATPVEAAEIAEAAGVGHLLYYHIVPPLPLPGLESLFVEGVSDAYSGPVTVGRDRTMVSLASGSESIELSNR